MKTITGMQLFFEYEAMIPRVDPDTSVIHRDHAVKKIDLSSYTNIQTDSDLVKTGVKNGYITWADTGGRTCKIEIDEEVDIPEGQSGDLYMFYDEKNASIWQMEYKGRSGKVCVFEGTAA